MSRVNVFVHSEFRVNVGVQGECVSRVNVSRMSIYV